MIELHHQRFPSYLIVALPNIKQTYNYSAMTFDPVWAEILTWHYYFGNEYLLWDLKKQNFFLKWLRKEVKEEQLSHAMKVRGT